MPPEGPDFVLPADVPDVEFGVFDVTVSTLKPTVGMVVTSVSSLSL